MGELFNVLPGKQIGLWRAAHGVLDFNRGEILVLKRPSKKVEFFHAKCVFLYFLDLRSARPCAE